MTASTMRLHLASLRCARRRRQRHRRVRPLTSSLSTTFQLGRPCPLSCRQEFLHGLRRVPRRDTGSAAQRAENLAQCRLFRHAPKPANPKKKKGRNSAFAANVDTKLGAVPIPSKSGKPGRLTSNDKTGWAAAPSPFVETPTTEIIQPNVPSLYL